MPFLTIPNKLTNATRPTVPANQKLTSAEFNTLKAAFNANYQELLNIAAALGVLPYVRFNSNITIVSAGIYVFYGASPRTVTINNAINGIVEIRTVATADLTLSASLTPSHLGAIFEGSAATVFRWDSVDVNYNF